MLYSPLCFSAVRNFAQVLASYWPRCELHLKKMLISTWLSWCLLFCVCSWEYSSFTLQYVIYTVRGLSTHKQIWLISGLHQLQFNGTRASTRSIVSLSCCSLRISGTQLLGLTWYRVNWVNLSSCILLGSPACTKKKLEKVDGWKQKASI